MKTTMVNESERCRCEIEGAECDCVRMAARTVILTNALALHPEGHVSAKFPTAFRILLELSDGSTLEATYRPREGWSVGRIMRVSNRNL